ncbi:unnamed protein product [Effrenium voratum]|uniref:EF-hand domain-containing protein n=1 Tax=Effrenium voratum TaxID=2562239 RepID=A0AA36ITW7_9DINO|nr:unnamed protein product [Effrenium voratum]
MDVNEALEELQRQQKASQEGIRMLKGQHEQWQSAVEALLIRVESFGGPQSVHVQPCPAVGDVLELSSMHTSERSESITKLPIDSTSKSWLRNSTLQKFEASKGALRKMVMEIVEDDLLESKEQQEESFWICRQAEALVGSRWFENVIGLVILVNMITIGVEAELSLGNNVPEWLQQLERAFLAIYTLEIILRLLAEGWGAFCTAWFLLDFFLVSEGIEKVLVVRGLRLLRLVRALRVVEHFRVVWQLVYALLSAGQTMLSTTALVTFMLYIFGCMAVELITKDDVLKSQPATTAIVEQYFYSLPRAILTLLQFVTLDSIAQVYTPLILERPYLAMYFFSILIFVSIGLMNLVTAVIIEGALDQAAKKHEEERILMKQKVKQSLPSLLETFLAIDVDGSGLITKEELANMPLDMLPPNFLKNLPIDSMMDLFEVLDVDDSNSVSQAEFVEGLLNLAMLDTPIWNIQSLKLLRRISDLTKDLWDPWH